jgi:hypothetical protein
MLKTIVKSGAAAAAIAGVALVGAPAHADIHTSGNGGVLSGNQVVAPISVPVNVCGNAIAILGIANAGCVGGAGVSNGGGHHGGGWGS